MNESKLLSRGASSKQTFYLLQMDLMLIVRVRLLFRFGLVSQAVLQVPTDLQNPNRYTYPTLQMY